MPAKLHVALLHHLVLACVLCKPVLLWQWLGMARATTSLACLTDETKTNENNGTSCCLLGNIMRIHLRENDAKMMGKRCKNASELEPKCEEAANLIEPSSLLFVLAQKGRAPLVSW